MTSVSSYLHVGLRNFLIGSVVRAIFFVQTRIFVFRAPIVVHQAALVFPKFDFAAEEFDFAEIVHRLILPNSFLNPNESHRET